MTNSIIKIHNVRFGLATNSSSSHSLVFLPAGQSFSSDFDDDNYGWGWFRLADKKSKGDYLATQLNFALQGLHNPEVANLIIRNWIGTEAFEARDLDHQSMLSWPLAFNSVLPDKEFFDELFAFTMRDDVMILGGNDNDDMPQEYESLDRTDFFGLADTGAWTARKDLIGYWSLFNPASGAKLRITFGEDNDFVPTKATAPELVDIKITDFCPFGCPFCYQGSTRAGVHADRLTVSILAHSLAELKVFEVALGGGEPTLHPYFGDILETFRKEGVVPNFTTRNMAWLRDPRKWKPWLDQAGAFAFSVSEQDEIRELELLIKLNGIDPMRVKLHIVMGTVSSAYQFKALLKAAYEASFGVTLLGYKTTGRGNEVKPIPYEWWMNVVTELRLEYILPAISIDTALAAEYEQQILDAGIPDYLFHTQEGAFSAYIDAVSMKMYPSSYVTTEGDELPKDEDKLADHIRDIFSRF